MAVTASSSEKVIRGLYQITNNHDQGFEAQIEQILKMGLERFNLDIGILSKIEDNQYIVKYCVVPDDVELTSGVEFDFNSTYCHITCQANEPTAIEHIGEDDRYANHPAYQAFGLESYIGMPIKLNGEIYGTLNFSSATPYKRQFQESDIDAIQLVTAWVEVEIIRRRQEKRLKELNQILERKAYEDSLTCIPNRRAMFKHVSPDVSRIIREQGKASLAIIDIDLFKNINDTYGHQIGDDVLKKVASALNESKRDYDFISRFGGEEFLLWLPNTNAQAAETVCTRIKNNIEKLSLCATTVTISIGISSYSDGDLQHLKNKQSKLNRLILDELISEADQALYHAKDAGRNCVKSYQRVTLTNAELAMC
ncbi:hypothetical protein GCM10007916_20990 [Psychromonas marina]|uniref:diguanylate cyclase n=1 Tax=Psychromonas marina TaxID=88364 RepID=A0ABQ6E0P8_9GAMM|nr:sensor domain-containing diguanylate cyclase [Psychromonas marina]GLS91031.1 hypothetical protein GCM10007916_20990 [Psychromonas marina]